VKRTRIVAIAGGFFQGKSSVALAVAGRLGFSAVISTDMVKSLLRILHPERGYLDSAGYSLADSHVVAQMREVSDTIIQLLDVYDRHQEHVVVEGLHLTDDFMDWIRRGRHCGICLDNEVPLRARILLKTKIRANFRVHASDASRNNAAEITESNVDSSRFMKDEALVMTLQASILDKCRDNGFHVLRFRDIEDAKNAAVDHVRAWFDVS
jgi:2-phosphoglycerate kinase